MLFAQKEVNYLEHVVSAAGVSPDEAKTATVSSNPVPADVKQLCQFLGLTNYYPKVFCITILGLQSPRDTACQEALADLKHRLAHLSIFRLQIAILAIH